jgi:hypothetical protein
MTRQRHSANTGSHMNPFTREELVQAMRRLLPEVDARELGDGAYAIGQASLARARAAGCPADDEAFLHSVAMNLSEDTLILPALASEKGAQTVHSFRRWRQAVSDSSAEWCEQDNASWSARYAQLAGALYCEGGPGRLHKPPPRLRLGRHHFAGAPTRAARGRALPRGATCLRGRQPVIPRPPKSSSAGASASVTVLEC